MSSSYEARTDLGEAKAEQLCLLREQGQDVKNHEQHHRQGGHGEGAPRRRLVHPPDAYEGKVEALQASEEADHRYPGQKLNGRGMR